MLTGSDEEELNSPRQEEQTQTVSTPRKSVRSYNLFGMYFPRKTIVKKAFLSPFLRKIATEINSTVKQFNQVKENLVEVLTSGFLSRPVFIEQLKKYRRLVVEMLT